LEKLLEAIMTVQSLLKLILIIKEVFFIHYKELCALHTDNLPCSF